MLTSEARGSKADPVPPTQFAYHITVVFAPLHLIHSKYYD